METDSEESDSDLSDVASLDSDLEKEQEKSYERSEVNSKAANLKTPIHDNKTAPDGEVEGVAVNSGVFQTQPS